MSEKIKNRIKESVIKIRKSKNGFSLTELLMCVAILGIIAVCVSLMMSSGTTQFNKLNKKVNVTYQTQLVLVQLKEFLIDCDAVCIDESNQIYVCNRSDETGDDDVFRFSFSGNKINMHIYNQGDLENEISDSPQPFANHITAFSMEVIKAPSGKKATAIKVIVESTFDDVSYKKAQVFALKNTPMLTSSTDVTGGEQILDKFAENIQAIGG